MQLLTFNPATNLVDLIEYHGRIRPKAEALVIEGHRQNWGDFSANVNRIANRLLAMGVGKGDKVAVLARGSADYFNTFFGILTAGACAVPLSGMATAETIALMVNDCDAKVLLISEDMRGLIDPVNDELTKLIDGGRIGFDFADDTWQGFAGWVGDASEEFPNIEILPEDDFNIIYSSGTTGVPKGILHSHGMRQSYWEGRDAAGYSAFTRCLLSTPIYSNTTLFAMLPAVAWGGTVILMPKSDAGIYLELVNTERPTHTIQVPVQYRRLFAHPDFEGTDFSSFVWKYSTSAPLQARDKEVLITKWGGAFTEIYGMTEGGVGCVLQAHEYPDKLHTVGLPMDPENFRIVDEGMNEVPQGEIGELIGHSPYMMTGYYNQPEKTSESRWTDDTGKTWQRSGDMGRMDEDGFVTLLDRIKDMIISGGFNVYAADLELVLSKHPDVNDCGVIGIPSDEWGETPLGLVVLNDGATASADDIKEWANAQLGKGQRLSNVELRDNLPRSTIGKLLKRELREPYWAGREQKV